ncbi:MAG: type II toxin-antitoxin system VapC family toxin [Rubrivivax sp.]|nr:type II toxin-antitoxin system VapC family toxin [Rubrivivax sp.]MBK7261444.1 type II toxin-antitoxin system VapC family toxin [Rubrivivax sp.]MBK8529498.1 type II toxin-antitoxin system VapC family toxin [Rubrivivax sp.]
MSQAPGFLLDSSVALGAFFEDEQDDYSLGVWRSLATAPAFVPALWHLEMGNILSRALRAGRISHDALADCWSRIDMVGLRVLPMHGDARHWTQRAADWGLSAYDACYLDTALQQRLPLATKDRLLADAARRVGVPIYLNRSPESRR